MSIATEITRLQGAKADLKTAIEGKGVTVPSATKIDGYASLVNQIEGGGGTPTLETLNVTPSTSAQQITPTSPVDGYDEVNVAAVTAAIDSNIQAENIKKDVEILGITGTYEGGSSETDGLNGFLSVESKTIATDASHTTNIAYNKKCGIYDENGKKWDTLEWHQRWVDNGYSATGLSKPTGIWMNAFGLEIIYLWPLEDENGYSDVTGTIEPTKNTFASSIYNMNAITNATLADRTVWPCNQSGMIAHGTAGKYNSDTWRSVINGDGLDYVCLNTGETFTIPSRDVFNTVAFIKDNYEDYMWSYYQQCEFFRALFAICSGIATSEADGATTTVEILNASGQQASVGEDMYFWIGGTNTGLLAKYNLNSVPNAGANTNAGILTQAFADAIYSAQKANGVNMNDTGVNSATKPVLLPGMKGAEAIAVNGYWYIKTPFISHPSASAFNASSNTADAPVVYLCKHEGVTLQTERRLYPYYLNKSTHITALVNLLRTTEGLSSDVPEVWSDNVTSALRLSANNMWYVSMANGIVYNAAVYYRGASIPCPSVSF